LAAHPLQDGSGHRDALWTVVDNGANDDAAAAAAILA